MSINFRQFVKQANVYDELTPAHALIPLGMAGVGAGAGALFGSPGHRLRGALRGAAIGGIGGLGSLAGGMAGSNMASGDINGGRAGSRLGSLAGILGADALLPRSEPEHEPEMAVSKEKKEPKKENKSDEKKEARMKQAGPVSEYMASFNPLNMYGGGLLGGAAALMTPTRSLQRQAEIDSTDNIGRALTNVLVPGVGAYRGFKRTGAAIRGPEMKALKAERVREEAEKELAKQSPPGDKQAGWRSEIAGTVLNPLSLFGGNAIGSLAATMTPTRTLEQQSKSDDSMLSNLLIPGRGVYNQWKRVGAATRSPEMLAMRSQARLDRLKQRAGKTESPKEETPEAPSKAASAYAFGCMVKQAFPDLGQMGSQIGTYAKNMWNSPTIQNVVKDPRAQAGLMYGGAGAVAGGLHGLLSPGEYEDAEGNVKRRGRLSGMLRGAVGGGVGGAGLGAGAQALHQYSGSKSMSPLDSAHAVYNSLRNLGVRKQQPAAAPASATGRTSLPDDAPPTPGPLPRVSPTVPEVDGRVPPLT